MQFLINVLNDTHEFGSPDEMEAVDVFNDKLVAGGHWVLAGGLSFPEEAVVIDNRGGKKLTTDGPFLESKEFIAGFWVIEADGMAQATELATEGSLACNRRVEVRGFMAPPEQ